MPPQHPPPKATPRFNGPLSTSCFLIVSPFNTKWRFLRLLLKNVPYSFPASPSFLSRLLSPTPILNPNYQEALMSRAKRSTRTPSHSINQANPKTIIQSFNENIRNLQRIDTDDDAPVISKSEFEVVSADLDLIEALCGRRTSNWKTFKENFCEYQRLEYGCYWKPGPGRGGPLNLQEVNVPGRVGEAIAAIMLRGNVAEGRFDRILEEQLQDLFIYIQDVSIITFQDAKNLFKSYSLNNRSYRFSVGNTQAFRAAINIVEVEYPNTSDHEERFGQALLPKIKKRLDLDYLEHTQRVRGASRYQNIDFQGLRIVERFDGSSISTYALELKRTNKIEDISQAIAQAINYSSNADFAYIVIPCFDPTSFHDADRHMELVSVCRANQIGVLSVDLDTGKEPYEVLDVQVVLAAPKGETRDIQPWQDIFANSGREHCPLCRRFVETNTRAGCGWLAVTSDDAEATCMKELLERRLLSSYEQ